MADKSQSDSETGLTLPPTTEDIIGISEEDFVDVSLEGMSADEVTSAVYFLWQQSANFGIHVISPTLKKFDQPVIIQPEALDEDNYEFVYPIQDWGNTLVTSKGILGGGAGQSMCRMNYTIEKIITLLIERLHEEGIDGEGGDGETEIEVAFEGHLVAQRYAFASIINLEENMVVVNFNPDNWGEFLLDCLARMNEKGYGYPPSSPRDIYRQNFGSKKSGPKS